MTDKVWMPVARRVQDALCERDEPSIMITPEKAAGLTVEITGPDFSIWFEDTLLATPDAVLYLRDPVPQCDASFELDAHTANFVTHQWQIMLQGLVTALQQSGVPVLNPVDSVLIDEKTAQLVLAAKVGFTTPNSLHTAHSGKAAAFANRHGGRCATKPFVPFARPNADGNGMQRLLTNLTNADDLARGLSKATVPSPTIVQPFVAAAHEHRVVVVGDAVFSARTARKGANAVDARRLPPSQANVTPGKLPNEVADRCVALVRAAGLDLAAIDLLETCDQGYVFLDLNPGGHFLWVEQMTGAPICAEIARLCVSQSSRANSRNQAALPSRSRSPMPCVSPSRHR